MPGTPVFDVHPDGQGTVAVSGELDVMSVAALRQTLLGMVDGRSEPLIVDLSDVDFIDAAGVGALVSVANAAVACGGRMVVTRPSAAVRRIMAILGPDWPLETS